MEKGKKIYEGKAKILYETAEPTQLIQSFKDDATAFDATKKGSITDKGLCNNKISTAVFKFLEVEGVETHFVELLNDREMLVKKVEILPIEVTIRNRVAGGMAKLLGIEEGRALQEPVLEYHYKDDSLHDPLINEYHIAAINLASPEELSRIQDMTFKINRLLIDYFSRIDLELVDFKLEFGRFQGRVILADEISPDTCRLWDKETGKKMDKDRFRRDLGQIEETYQEVMKRVLKNC
ncbi:MAG: phosphoribosylaminoimidazolesuccinocarboxamide synthase [Candidatus Omnitrophota bacterium]|nr:phosphoribosylaminoimidazolesuccinocarboxamide synthase [Candidatus Omnitrophota bacterium]